MNIDELIDASAYTGFDESLEGVVESIKSFAKKVYDKVIAFFKKVKNFFVKLFGGSVEEPAPLSDVESGIKEGVDMSVPTEDVDEAKVSRMATHLASLQSATSKWTQRASDAVNTGSKTAIAAAMSAPEFWNGVKTTVSKLGGVSAVKGAQDSVKQNAFAAVNFVGMKLKRGKPNLSAKKKAYATATSLFKEAKLAGRKLSGQSKYDIIVSDLKKKLYSALGKKEPSLTSKAYSKVLSQVKAIAAIEFKSMKYLAGLMRDAKKVTASAVSSVTAPSSSKESNDTLPYFY
jgi:hypothetical protein